MTRTAQHTDERGDRQATTRLPLRLLLLSQQRDLPARVNECLRKGILPVECLEVSDHGALDLAFEDQVWDVVLIEVCADGIDDARVATVVRARAGDAPVILLSNSNSPARIDDAWRGGFEEIVAVEQLDTLVDAVERSMRIAGERRARRRAEARLERVERRYRAAIEHSQDLICRYDTQGRLTFVNDAFCQFFDIPRPKLTGRHLREFAPPKEQLTIRRQIAMLAHGGGSCVTSYRVIDRDRRLRWIRWVNHVIPESDGSVHEIQAIGQDITAQKEAELAVAESEQRFRIAAECATDLIYERRFDGAMLNWFGARSHRRAMNLALPGSHEEWLAMIVGEDRRRVREALDDHLKSGSPYELEYCVIDARGRRRYLIDRGSVTFDEQGDPYKWIGAIDDVTEGRLAERSLRENQARLNYRLSLERVISELSSRLHSVESENDVAEAMAPALARMGSLMHAERGYIVEILEDDRHFVCVREWRAEGVGSREDLFQKTSVDAWRELFNTYAAGEAVYAARPDALEDRFQVLQRFMRRSGVISIATVPIFYDRSLRGVLGFENERTENHWMTEDVRLMQTAAEIIGRAIGNVRNRQRLIETNRTLECLDRLSRSLSGSSCLDDVLSTVTDATRDVLGAKCAWLAYPCDPDARNIRVRNESVAPGSNRSSTGRSELMARLPDMMRDALGEHSEPLWAPVGDAQEESGSRMFVSIPVRVGKPWLFGVDFRDVEQPRTSDRDVFAALAERAVDAMSEALLLDELRDNEARLDEAQSVGHVGSFEIDWSENRLWWSREAFNIFEIAPEDFDERVETQFRAVHPIDATTVLEDFEKALENRDPFDSTFMLALSDGATKHVNLRCVTRSDEHGSVRTIGTVQDISAQKMIEDALRQTHKLEAVGQLTGGIAHDFNNLLSIILGNLDLVLRDADLSGQFVQRVGAARRAAQRGADLTRKLLSVSRKTENRPEIVDVNQVLVDMEELISRSLTPKVHVRTAPDAGLFNALVDPGALQDALLNLVINARDAMPDGGELLIETRNVSRDSVDGMDAAGPRKSPPEADAYVCIRVTDRGVGMTPEVRERALEPFFTTKEPGKGTGLGLAMIYAFVTQSGGLMEIDSAPGLGTVVTLYLPAAENNSPVVRDATETSAPLTGGSEKILVVDDEVELVELAEEFLNELGYRTVCARNGPEALETLARERDVDLLFSDVLMPGGMDGYELADRARQLFPDLKVLLCSGYAERAGGADRHATEDRLLRKPYRADDLSEAIRHAMESDP